MIPKSRTYEAIWGYGWSHDYEYHVEEYNGIITFYTAPSSYVHFVKADALESHVFGQMTDDGVLLAQGAEYSYGEYHRMVSESGKEGIVATNEYDM